MGILKKYKLHQRLSLHQQVPKILEEIFNLAKNITSKTKMGATISVAFGIGATMFALLSVAILIFCCAVKMFRFLITYFHCSCETDDPNAHNVASMGLLNMQGGKLHSNNIVTNRDTV